LPAIAGGSFLGLAGIFHALRYAGMASANEWTALVSDLWVLITLLLQIIHQVAMQKKEFIFI